jgi:hypothetical protein
MVRLISRPRSRDDCPTHPTPFDHVLCADIAFSASWEGGVFLPSAKAALAVGDARLRHAEVVKERQAVTLDGIAGRPGKAQHNPAAGLP